MAPSKPPRAVKVLVPRQGSKKLSASLLAAVKAAAAADNRKFAAQGSKALAHSSKAPSTENASEWNSLLVHARAERGPQFDVATQMFHVDVGSELFYDSTPLTAEESPPHSDIPAHGQIAPEPPVTPRTTRSSANAAAAAMHPGSGMHTPQQTPSRIPQQHHPGMVHQQGHPSHASAQNQSYFNQQIQMQMQGVPGTPSHPSPYHPGAQGPMASPQHGGGPMHPQHHQQQHPGHGFPPQQQPGGPHSPYIGSPSPAAGQFYGNGPQGHPQHPQQHGMPGQMNGMHPGMAQAQQQMGMIQHMNGGQRQGFPPPGVQRYPPGTAMSMYGS